VAPLEITVTPNSKDVRERGQEAGLKGPAKQNQGPPWRVGGPETEKGPGSNIFKYLF
jgi:hypothetical protein